MAWSIWLAVHTGGDVGDLKDLQLKSDSGNLVIVTGSATGTGAVASYTPANGKTFVLYKAKARIYAVNIGNFAEEFVIRGDTLAGDGVKTYDINISSISGAGNTIYATLEGYLE